MTEVKRPPRDVTTPTAGEIVRVKKAKEHLREAIFLLESISNDRPDGDFPDARTAIIKANAAQGYCDDLIELVEPI